MVYTAAHPIHGAEPGTYHRAQVWHNPESIAVIVLLLMMSVFVRENSVKQKDYM